MQGLDAWKAAMTGFVRRKGRSLRRISALEAVNRMTDVGTRNLATREDWLERALWQIPAGVRILDAGAGEQKYRKFCAHLEYVSQDFGEYDGVGDRAGLQMGSWDQTALDIVSDITDIPEPDESFDAIMCIEVFEHLPDPLAALRELARLLKRGGTMIITAPFCSLTHFAPYHFHTGFNRYFYEKHLPECGLEIVEIDINGNFFEFLAQEVRRVPDIAKRYANSRPSKDEQKAMDSVLKILGRLSGEDRGSSEFLNFGLHVRAIKI